MAAARGSDWRLHKHADYQRVYKSSRKQFSSLMAYFVSRAADPRANAVAGPRVGLTAGRVLGNAVERNQIKRRMRAVVRQNLPLLTHAVDVVLHPKRSVLDAEFSTVAAEVERIFRRIELQGMPRSQDGRKPHE